jgi:hypothetical protein
VNILKWNTKEPLPVFMLTFEGTENIKKIYEITAIRDMNVGHPIQKNETVTTIQKLPKLGTH